MRCEGGQHRGNDGGFTLIELLMVTVVLGVLSAIVIFSVRGISAQAEEGACASDLRTLVTAQEAHAALNGDAVATEGELVTAGLLREESALWDINVDFGGGFTIGPAPGTDCTGGTSGTGAAAPLPDPGPLTPTPISFGVVPAVQHGVGGADDEIVVFGRGEALYDFTVIVNDATPTSRRITLIDLDLMLDEGDIDYVMDRSRTNGVTDWAIYPDDDTTSLAASSGPDWPSVGAYLATVAAGDPLHQLDAGGPNLASLLLSIG